VQQPVLMPLTKEDESQQDLRSLGSNNRPRSFKYFSASESNCNDFSATTD